MTTSEHGIEFKLPHAHVFFGFASANLDILKNLFHQYSFRELRQVHGAVIVPADDSLAEADGHWSGQSHIALCIKTADCLPVMLVHPQKVCALHAGWRGLYAEILISGARSFATSETQAFIGPHIGPCHFEVGLDVAQQLEKSFQTCRGRTAQDLPNSILLSHAHSEKKYVDLRTLAVAQLRHAGIPSSQIHCVEHDTFASTSFHSYRRDREKAGRQISFVSRLES